MARIQSFSRDLKLLVDGALSPKVRQGLIADAARQVLTEAQAQNQDALGFVPDHQQIVDRVRGAPFDAVDPDHGIIVIEFDIRIDVFAYIGKLLVENSPVLTGRYQDSHRLYADGVEVSAYDPAINAEEWIFLSTVPYARKIERGESDQAPDGVYQSVAVMAAQRFGNLAAIKFTYRSAMLDYVAGEHGKGAKRRMQQQPARRSAMAMERATRFPAIYVRLL